MNRKNQRARLKWGMENIRTQLEEARNRADICPIQVSRLFIQILIPLIPLLIFTSLLYSILFNPAGLEIEKRRLSHFITQNNRNISSRERKILVDAIIREASRLNVNGGLKINGAPLNRFYFLTALIQVESSFNRRAVSRSNARGYMQILPATHTWMNNQFGKEAPLEGLFETNTNISYGVSYMNYLLSEFDDTRSICLAYNVGPGSLKRGQYVARYWKKIKIAYSELQNTPSDSIEF